MSVPATSPLCQNPMRLCTCIVATYQHASMVPAPRTENATTLNYEYIRNSVSLCCSLDCVALIFFRFVVILCEPSDVNVVRASCSYTITNQMKYRRVYWQSVRYQRFHLHGRLYAWRKSKCVFLSAFVSTVSDQASSTVYHISFRRIKWQLYILFFFCLINFSTTNIFVSIIYEVISVGNIQKNYSIVVTCIWKIAKSNNT